MSRDTPEEREFAVNCGWTLNPPYDSDEENYEVWRNPDGGVGLGHYERGYLPDFLNDLNACFEALEWFCKQHKQFAEIGLSGLQTGFEPWHCRITPQRDFELGWTAASAIIRAVNAAAKARPR